MKLKTAELKKFKQYAAMIPTNTLLPICSYLHFKKGAVTKSALNSFVTMEIECDQELLIDERILMSVVSQAGDEIDVKVKGKQIILNGNLKDYSPTDDPANFPVNEDASDLDWTTLEAQSLYDIGTCSSLIFDDINMPARSHVFINNCMIAGGDGVVVYAHKVEGLPDFVLSKQASSIIGKFELGRLAQSESYQFFDSMNVLFGFIKPAFGPMDFTPFFNYEKVPGFSLNKAAFISFNDHVASTMILPNPRASLEVKGGNIYLEVNDSAYERAIVKDLPCIGECEEFEFVVPQMNRLLKALPDSDLTFTPSKNMLYITGETGFISLIMRVKK